MWAGWRPFWKNGILRQAALMRSEPFWPKARIMFTVKTRSGTCDLSLRPCRVSLRNSRNENRSGMNAAVAPFRPHSGAEGRFPFCCEYMFRLLE